MSQSNPTKGPARLRSAVCLALISLVLAGCCCRSSAVGPVNPEAKSMMRTFDYNGISIRYTDSGSGQPFVFLHGFGASSYSWRHLAGYFAKDYRVIAIDLKGF